LSSFFA